MFTIVFSNDDIYLFDLNKLMRLTKNENDKLYKKYYQLKFIKQGKITALDTEFKDEEIEEEEINI